MCVNLFFNDTPLTEIYTLQGKADLSRGIVAKRVTRPILAAKSVLSAVKQITSVICPKFICDTIKIEARPCDAARYPPNHRAEIGPVLIP